MKQFDDIIKFLKTIQKIMKIKDSIALSLFSGFLGTLAMDLSNTFFWRIGKTETLYGHIAGSVFVRPFRTNQRKNFWLGQITHLITGATLAIPLNLLLQKTGKDLAILKGAFFGAVTWEFIYGIGKRLNIFDTHPLLTKTHYTELFNNILYGITTAQMLVTLSEPSAYPDTQSKATATAQDNQKNTTQPIYSDSNLNGENQGIM